jgi:hypothetical protein
MTDQVQPNLPLRGAGHADQPLKVSDEELESVNGGSDAQALFQEWLAKQKGDVKMPDLGDRKWGPDQTIFS